VKANPPGPNTTPLSCVLEFPHHARFARPRNRDGAPVLHRTCSGPPTDSPSGCPKCQASVGSMMPPTSSPSIHSARRQAAPRAQRAKPDATIGAHRLRAPRWAGVAYFALSARNRTSDLHLAEQ
jgi:hypothetical protein